MSRARAGHYSMLVAKVDYQLEASIFNKFINYETSYVTRTDRRKKFSID